MEYKKEINKIEIVSKSSYENFYTQNRASQGDPDGWQEFARIGVVPVQKKRKSKLRRKNKHHKQNDCKAKKIRP